MASAVYSVDDSQIDRLLGRMDQIGSSQAIRNGLVQSAAIYLDFIRRRYVRESRGGSEWPPLAESTKLARLKGNGLRNAKDKLSRARSLSDSLEARAAIGKESSRRRLVALRVKLGQAQTAEQSRKIRRRIQNLLQKTRSKKAAAKQAGSTDSVALPKTAILRDTGLLFNSLSRGAPASVEVLEPLAIRVGTAIHYAKYHQDGGPRLPQRRILVPPDEPTAQRINQILARAVQAALQES